MWGKACGRGYQLGQKYSQEGQNRRMTTVLLPKAALIPTSLPMNFPAGFHPSTSFSDDVHEPTPITDWDASVASSDYGATAVPAYPDSGLNLPKP